MKKVTTSAGTRRLVRRLEQWLTAAMKMWRVSPSARYFRASNLAPQLSASAAARPSRSQLCSFMVLETLVLTAMLQSMHKIVFSEFVRTKE
eukprot:3455301-Pleurochrysis_carterae.AAC.1